MDGSPHELQQLEAAYLYLDNAHTAWGCRTYEDLREAERRIGGVLEDPRIWNDIALGATLDTGDAYDVALATLRSLLAETDPDYYEPLRRQGGGAFRLAVEARMAQRARARAAVR